MASFVSSPNPFMLSYSTMRATYPAYLVLRDFITRIIFTGTPNSVIQTSPCQTNSCSGLQEIYFHFVNPGNLLLYLSLCLHVVYPEPYECSPRLTILFTYHTYYSTVLPSVPRSCKWFFPLGFPTNPHVRITVVPQASIMLPQSSLSFVSSFS